MKSAYSDLFKEIVKAYYEDNFEAEVTELMNNSTADKEELFKVISSLCGVDVKYSKNYISDLETAIRNYKPDHKIVTKEMHCDIECADEIGKTNCEKSCPFDAILMDKKNHTSYIDEDKCTDCGACVESCDRDRILDKVEFIPFAHLLKENVPVIAAVAPAIMGQFGKDVKIGQLRAAFKKIGFTDMVEVAFFADMLTLKEAVEFDEHVKDKEDFMITSCCCPMWVGMLKRVYNDLVKHVSPSVSPMIASGRVIKALNSECKVVFVGPCIAKKAEAKERDLIGDIDYVLTFTEVKDIFDALDVNPKDCHEDLSSEYASRGGRLYARTGGVSIAVSDAVERLFPAKHKLLVSTHANGVPECKAMLSKVQSGEIKANFIEGMGCVGGCVGGPKAIIPKEEGRDIVNNFADNSEIKVSVDSNQMKNILKELNIEYIDDFKDKEKVKIFERKF